MKFTHFALAVLAVLSFAVLTGCSDNPGLVGAGLLPSDGALSVVDTTLFAATDTVYSVPFAAGLGTNILVGTWNGYSAVALLKFTGVSLPDSLSKATIDTACIVLTNSYSWNLSNTQNNYVVRPMGAVWTESDITRDALPRIWDSLGVQCGTWTSPFAAGGTTTVFLDTATARLWLTNKQDSTHFNGFALHDAHYRPGVVGAANGIIGFSSFQTYGPPRLLIKYHLGNYRDSIAVSSGEDTFLATGAINSDPAMQPCLEIQGGISIRSRVAFNLGSIPKGSIVNSATFSISAKDRMIGIGTEDSIAVFPSLSAATPDNIDGSIYAYGSRSDPSGVTYAMSSAAFRSIVQRWITGFANNGIVIRSATDGYSMDRVLFYPSTEATTTLRPQLRIIYSKKM
ncbi:MAG: hypothetical protein NTV54_03285 [Ignavibacteriales bacterium]|nr:hypothetical protein [Ignavibacteriales bacterium]